MLIFTFKYFCFNTIFICQIRRPGNPKMDIKVFLNHFKRHAKQYFTQVYSFLSTSNFPFLIQQPKSKISASRKLSLKVGLPTLLYTLFHTWELLLKLLFLLQSDNASEQSNRGFGKRETGQGRREKSLPRRKKPSFAAFWTLSGRVTGDTLSQKEHFN